MTGKLYEALWCIIINPKAGGGKVAKKWPSIEVELKQAGLTFQVYFTEKKGHAARLVQDAVDYGFRHILGIGGDGTNSEIVHGILSQKICPSTDILYALFPLGRGNDWARAYAIQGNIKAFLNRIEQPNIRYQDAGQVHYQAQNKAMSRYFVNVAGMAYDGYLVKKSEETTSGIAHGLHYQWMILRCLASYVAPKGSVTFNGKVVTDTFYLINIGLCKYSGGGMQLVPHAVPDDGLFALTIAGNVPKWDVLLQTPRFYNGNIGNYRLIQLHESKAIQVEHQGSEPIHIEVDGEYLGTTPARFELLEKAIRILV